jgi:hypothetical protein
MLAERRIDSETFTPAMMKEAREQVPSVADYIEGRRRRGVPTLGLSWLESLPLMTRGLAS